MNRENVFSNYLTRRHGGTEGRRSEILLQTLRLGVFARNLPLRRCAFARNLAVILFFLVTLSLSAQTAAEMDALLETNAVSAGMAARFVLGSLQLLPEGFSGEAAERAAYDMAQARGWVKAAAGDSITLKETAFLVMKAFELRGGIMYSMAKNPRYAYRELVYRKIIQGKSDPAMKVSGRRLLHIIDRAHLFANAGLQGEGV
ncbi:MAG: hypothetical protein FWG07_06795 [Treponema sp.]|nr:hypothetical protein [Treponema sp.]